MISRNKKTQYMHTNYKKVEIKSLMTSCKFLHSETLSRPSIWTIKTCSKYQKAAVNCLQERQIILICQRTLIILMQSTSSKKLLALEFVAQSHSDLMIKECLCLKQNKILLHLTWSKSSLVCSIFSLEA